MALLAHTSDRTQPLDVSVCGLMKHCVKDAIYKHANVIQIKYKRFKKFGRGDVSDSLVKVYGLAVTKKMLCQDSGILAYGNWILALLLMD